MEGHEENLASRGTYQKKEKGFKGGLFCFRRVHRKRKTKILSKIDSKEEHCTNRFDF